MKSKYPSLLACLLTIGLLGASGSKAAAIIDNRISDQNAADISQIAEINAIQEINLSDGIAELNAISGTISARGTIISIDASRISDISRIANILDNQINAEITEIAA